MSYFRNLRRIVYQFPDNVNRIINDFSMRPKFRDIVLENSTNYEFYEINDGDTLETVSYQQYGDVSFHWAIAIANDISSIYTDWPKSQKSFDEYLFQKYKFQTDSDGDTVTFTRDQVVEFIQFKGTSGNNYSGYVTGTTVAKKPSHFIDTDKNIYEWSTIRYGTDRDAFGRAIVLPSVSPVSIEEVESAANEEKREIIIPKKRIVTLALKELEEFENG